MYKQRLASDNRHLASKKDTSPIRGTYSYSLYICQVEVSSEHINLFLSKCKNANWAGVFYSPPFSKTFQFILQDLNTIQEPSQEQFIFHPFNEEFVPRVVVQVQHTNAEALQYLNKEVVLNTYWESPLLTGVESTEKAMYERNFKNYQLSIQSGKCSKAILSTIIKKEISTVLNMGEYIFNLRKTYPQAFIYLFSSPITGTWIGATPETLLKWDSTIISTMSLAGTKKKDDPNFVFGEKEKTEQKIVTQYIRKIFEEKFGIAHFDEPTEFSYGEMVHLITKISAKQSDHFQLEDFMELAEKLHPTPAVGGYPKQEARDLISSTENHPRLYYSGYLGPVSANAGELAVNLRCMCVTGKHVFVFAGGGITGDSKLEAEWMETRLKADALLKFL